MPSGDLFLLLKMATRLEARERLERIADLGVGCGVVKKQTAQSWVRALKRQAEPPRVHRKPTAEQLRAFGFEVKHAG